MLSLKLFGGASLFDDGGPLTGPPAQRRRLALLALLAAAPDGGVSREKLIGYLWPETGSEQARRFLADSIYSLRKALGQDAIIAEGDHLRLNPAVIRSDVGEFRAARVRGDRQAAASRYQGPFLDGFFVPDAPEFERWSEAERERCAREFAQVLEALAEERERAGDLRAAVEWWRRLAAHDPYSSRVALRLMQALAAAGDPGGALQHARVHEALLRDALEVEPDAEVLALVKRIRTPAVTPTRLPELVTTSEPDATEMASGIGGLVGEPADASDAHTGNERVPQPPAPAGADAPGPRRWLIGAAALVLLTVLVGAPVLLRSTPTPDARRVFVAGFDNQTGDPALDPLGRMAADWIARGLLQTGSLEVVSPATSPDAGAEGERPLRALAREAGAGTVVTGAYYLEGGVLRLQAQVTDVVRGSLLQTLEPLSVPVDSATAGVELLRQQVATVLAARFDWPQELREITRRRQPPTYSAYSAYIEGLEVFGLDLRQSVEPFERAWALDSTFYLARLYSILVYSQTGAFARADSLARELSRHRDVLSPFERAFLDRSQADIAGDREAALRSARRMTALAPGSQFIIGHAGQAIWANRPREAATVLLQLDPKLGLIQEIARESFLTVARHMLRKHRQELKGAHQARKQHPELRTFLWESQALAALGQADAVERLLQESVSLPPILGLTPGVLMRTAAAELRAHGHPDAAGRASEQALAWYDARPTEERPHHRLALARTLYEARHWEEARALFVELAAEQPGNVQHLGHLGTLAARRGERAEAERISAVLAASSQPYLPGAHTLWRARIAAQLGEQEPALRLLREAFAQGQPYGLWLHVDPDFEPLRELSSYRELLRPKG